MKKLFDIEVESKLMEAGGILRRSAGELGFFAGSGVRYENQYWTRDMALAFCPAASAFGRCLYSMEDMATVGLLQTRREHLRELARRQGRNGAIPILFSDFPELLIRKLRKCSYHGTNIDVGNSFLLKRIFDGMLGDAADFPEFADFPKDDLQRGLYRLTPMTTDSELFFALAVYNYAPELRDFADTALKYLEKNYMRDGLMVGADWRDTMQDILANVPLLSNNSLLYALYRIAGHDEKAETLKRNVEKTLFCNETYLDYPGAIRFDPFGASLGVLHGLIPETRYQSVMEGFLSVDTKHGVTAECKHVPHRPEEAEVIERTNGVAVFPFIVGFTILAAIHMGEMDFAREQFRKLHELNGFAEWYDPSNGSRFGEYEQGWSAALYLCVVGAFRGRGAGV
ncbi:MAG: hypothetical protein HYT94_02630 [Parcubacteria group bacterium]|nr:hypothetical protein [Parcubacteria group bacterium]